MDDYLTVAKRKIADLIRQEDFERIEIIKESHVILVFESRACKVTNFGNVKWRKLHQYNR